MLPLIKKNLSFKSLTSSSERQHPAEKKMLCTLAQKCKTIQGLFDTCPTGNNPFRNGVEKCRFGFTASSLCGTIFQKNFSLGSLGEQNGAEITRDLPQGIMADCELELRL